MCICATPPRVCVCDASAQQQQNVTPDGRQQPSTSQSVAFSLTLSYLSRSPDLTLIFTQCQSDKLNCKHLITFNPVGDNKRGVYRYDENAAPQSYSLWPQSLFEGPVIFSEECEP